MNNIDTLDQIDQYLLGRMDKTQKNDFEKLLSNGTNTLNSDMNLQKEVELRKKITMAVKERGLRTILKKEEDRIRRNERQVRILKISTISSGFMAIAAVILLLIIVAPISQQMIQYSDSYITDMMSEGQIRGENTSTGMVFDNVALLMENGQWEEVKNELTTIIATYSKSDIAQAQDIMEEAEWLLAIYYMHQGKYFIAKHKLRSIAKSDSFYAYRAKEALLKFNK